MKKILLLAGDGIGPEIMAEALKVLEFLKKQQSLDITFEEEYIGGSGYDQYGSPCADSVLEKAKKADAILLGAVGGPKWDALPYEKKPERGLLALRKELDLFSNLRPALCFEALAQASTLKKEIISGLDIMIVRELTSGVYFGEPRAITGQSPDRVAVDTQRYTESEITRIAHSAFQLAEKRSKKVTSCEKSNVMKTGILWKEIVTDLHQKQYPHIELHHMYADNTAMQLVRNPKQFDVILTDNLFGDILSDVAAMLTGSLGMLPSASMGTPKEGHLPALYEPVHGSAPDIANKNIANPLAMILSVAMMLRYSFGDIQSALRIEQAVDHFLKTGKRTADIADKDSIIISTSDVGESIIKYIK